MDIKYNPRFGGKVDFAITFSQWMTLTGGCAYVCYHPMTGERRSDEAIENDPRGERLTFEGKKLCQI